MIPLDEFKASLGPLAHTLSEEQIRDMRELMDRLADIVFDAWLRDKNKPKS